MSTRFFTPRWIGWHALALVAVLALGRTGRWQWDTARSEGDWQNYGYALQWWLFAALAVFLWVKLVLDELDPSRLEDRQADVSTLPPVVQRQAPPPAEDEDDELAAYNRHLAWLAQNADR